MAPDMETMLQRYADVIVKVGLNLQPGQTLMLEGVPVVAAPLVRLVVESAYRAGARFVDVMWSDAQVDLLRFRHAPRNSFGEVATWRYRAALDHAERGDPRLHISAYDPDLLKGQDPELIRVAQEADLEHGRKAVELYYRGTINQTLVPAAEPGWAAKVFPDVAPEERMARLWEAIFASCLVDQPDPVAAWQEYIALIEGRCRYLRDRRYAALHFRGPGTDLTIGLPEGQVWLSCRWVSESGVPFFAEMPGDELFTLPHKDRVEGYVTIAQPRNYRGTLIEGARLEFARGRVVKATAKEGEAILRSVIAMDEGASHLGEIALVASSTYIARSGRLFHSILFDENAGSHIALGYAYRPTLEGGLTMTDAEFAAAGGTISKNHIDVVIGSPQVDVDGLSRTGAAEPVMRSGEWAFTA